MAHTGDYRAIPDLAPPPATLREALDSIGDSEGGWRRERETEREKEIQREREREREKVSEDSENLLM